MTSAMEESPLWQRTFAKSDDPTVNRLVTSLRSARDRVGQLTTRIASSSASIFDHGIEMMQLDPFRQFGPFFFTQTDHIELLHNHPSQLWPQLTGRQLIMPVYDVE